MNRAATKAIRPHYSTGAEKRGTNVASVCPSGPGVAISVALAALDNSRDVLGYPSPMGVACRGGLLLSRGGRGAERTEPMARRTIITCEWCILCADFFAREGVAR